MKQQNMCFMNMNFECIRKVRSYKKNDSASSYFSRPFFFRGCWAGQGRATSCSASYEVYLVDATMTDMASTLSEKTT
jgi:hypothetical protein